MKLLFDANLSHRLVEQLNDLYPHSIHVKDLSLERASDKIIWQHAHDNEYIIVTRDSDFYELTLKLGFPPKIVWIRRENCTTSRIESLLRKNHSKLKNFSADPENSCLILI